MKRTSFILMAFALVMTITQCKKNEEQPTANDNVVTITLNVNKSNGSKVVVDPAMGTVDFETGDKLYVGSGGKYVGFLTHNGTNFSGNITNPTENQPLQLYFLGNVTPQETLSAGTTEECSVIISDQTEHLPVISCAASNENYVSGVTAYSAHLLNKCALVKFNVTTPSIAAICIMGMNNKVVVDFSDNTMAYDQDGDGIVMLSGGNGEKWAILLPQESMEGGGQGTVYSEDGNCFGMRPVMPTIIENGYLSEGITISLNNTANCPIGAIDGLFTVSPNKQVWFSQGNLAYFRDHGVPYWSFFYDQCYCYGTVSGQGSHTCDGVGRDLFCWATSGYQHNQGEYHPCATLTQGSFYYAYNSADYDLNDFNGQADWGYNAIDNAGNMENIGWRTLTYEEWDYVLNTRNTVSNIRFAKAQIDDNNGLILLPDNWNVSLYQLNQTNEIASSFESNIISTTDWVDIFENAGAVFLCAAGYRYDISIRNVNVMGYYWSATHYDENNCYSVNFGDGVLSVTPSQRGRGVSVRLVHDY